MNEWHRKLTLSGLGLFFLVFFVFKKMYNQRIRKAKLEKEVTTLYLTFKLSLTQCITKPTEDNVIQSNRLNHQGT